MTKRYYSLLLFIIATNRIDDIIVVTTAISGIIYIFRLKLDQHLLQSSANIIVRVSVAQVS
jgi:hypothetical protein